MCLCYRIRLFLFWMLKDMFVFQDQIVFITDVKGYVCVTGSDCFYYGC